MTSSNGNIFRVTGHLCGEFTGPRWIPRTKASDASFDVFFDPRLIKQLSKHSRGWWFETLPRPLWRHSNANLWGIIIITKNNTLTISRRHLTERNSIYHGRILPASHRAPHSSPVRAVKRCLCEYEVSIFSLCVLFNCIISDSVLFVPQTLLSPSNRANRV